jgi:hypothetical protein
VVRNGLPALFGIVLRLLRWRGQVGGCVESLGGSFLNGAEKMGWWSLCG